jgi:hypothetical protein
VSSSLTSRTLVSWLHAEAFRPRSGDDEEGYEDSLTIVPDLISDFLHNDDWLDVRRATAPLQWIQLSYIARNASMETDLIRQIYKTALGLVEDKHKSIILSDQLVFEESYGSLENVFAIREEILRAAGASTVKSSKKFPREERHTVGKPVKRGRMVEYPAEPDSAVLVSKPSTPAHPTCVYMRDIPFNIKEDQLSKFLAADCGAGEPVKLVIVKDEKGKSRGFGYAEFETPEQAAIAVSKSGTKLKSRYVIISPSDRGITVKREHSVIQTENEQESHVSSDEVKARNNEYFRNLIARKHKNSYVLF